MPRTVCPSCGHKLRVPEHLADRGIVCDACGEILPGPALPHALPEARAGHSPEAPPLPLPARLGIASVALGLSSVPVLCVPVVGYAALPLSGVGLLLGLGGLLAALAGGAGAPRSAPGGAATLGHFGARGRDYPLAGVAACLLALVLGLLPFLIH